MGYVSGIRWSEQKIKEEIYKVMNVLDIKRMPSKSEIEKITGDSKLTNAIRRNGGFYNTANRLGLEIKESETKLGTKGEYYIKELLEKKGYKVEKMGVKHPYDLLINSNVKIDVKTAKIYRDPRGTEFYTFNLEKKNPTCDIYILLKLEEKKIYIIPSKFVKQTQISMGAKSKYDKYENQWDYIESYDSFYKSVI